MEVASQTDYDEREAGKLSTADAGKLVDGGNLWNKVDWESNRNKRNETIEGLKRLEKEVPDLSTAKHWQELEREGDPSKVNSKIEKINAGSLTYYMRLLDQSGAFQAGGVFGEFLQEERDGLLKGFNKLDLSKGNPSKIEVIRDIKDTLKPKKEFMEKYKKQTPFVKQLFDDALPTLGLRRSKDGQIIGSKEELLDDIIEEVGKMEDEPPAIQKEFRKRSKGKALKPDQLKKLAKEIQEEWGKLNGKYTGEIFKNMNFFGGRTVETPEDGPMSLTASEFIGEFRELEDLATMKVWLKKLPNYIKDRQKLYAKRDKLLEQATTEDKARFEKITGKMRRHELKAYIADTLEPSIRSNNLMTAEFVGEIVTARGKGNMDLYNSFERAQKKVKFTAATLEQQKAMLTVERMEIGQRREVVDVSPSSVQ